MWSRGKIDGYSYCVKHYEVGSHFGIGVAGRISKLEIRKDGRLLYNYDRGIDFDNLDEGGKTAYEKILAKYN